jgi:hypothetical protein
VNSVTTFPAQLPIALGTMATIVKINLIQERKQFLNRPGLKCFRRQLPIPNICDVLTRWIK